MCMESFTDDKKALPLTLTCLRLIHVEPRAKNIHIDEYSVVNRPLFLVYASPKYSRTRKVAAQNTTENLALGTPGMD